MEENKALTEKLKFDLPKFNKKIIKSPSTWKKILNYNPVLDEYQDFY